MTERLPTLFLDDRLWRANCACLAGCRHLVETLRMGTGRYRRLHRVYVATTPSELLDLPESATKDRLYAMAVLDLEAYANINAVMEAARTRTEKRGRVTRDVSKARRLGYTVKPFVFENHIPDVVEIHQSKDTRQGKPMGAYYQKTIEELGGAPTQLLPLTPPHCPEHHWSYWGVFLPREGHMQDAVRTDEQLVGYIRMRRQGDSASYTAIMGHGEHLINGIMYLLHFEIVEAMMNTSAAQRPRYLVYQNSHPRSTLGEWKRRALFDPRYLHYVDERALAFPEGPPPPLDQGRRALKVSLQYPKSALGGVAELFNVSEGWINLLQRAWVIEQARGPGAVSALLEHGPNAIETLQHFRSELIPLEALDLSHGVSVALSGGDRGADTLLPLCNAGVQEVEVFDARPNALQALQECYGPEWTYAQWTVQSAFSADHIAAIVECGAGIPLAGIAPLLVRFSGTVLLSLHETTLADLGFPMEKVQSLYRKDRASAQEMERALSGALGRAIAYRAIHYRCADPFDVFWLSLSLAQSGEGGPAPPA